MPAPDVAEAGSQDAPLDPPSASDVADGRSKDPAPPARAVDGEGWRGARARGWMWAWATVLVVVLAGLIPLLFTSAFYWRGDTQVTYFGAWYRLGEALRAGDYPLMEPFAWRGGNHIVEGNIGLLSPVVMLIGLGATVVGNAIVWMTFCKVLFLGLAANGNYLLARSYRVPRPAAMVVGILVPLCGFTMYLDAPTWFPGLMVTALLAYTWWALRGTLLLGWNPALPLVMGVLLVTIGYVFGTVMLAFVVAACIVDMLVQRRYPDALKGVAIGFLVVIPAAVVRMPYLASAAVTAKDSFDVHNDGGGVVSLSDLLASSLPTNGVVAPIIYTAWVLPFLVFVDWRKARQQSRDLIGILLVWVVSLALVLGPSDIGPLRYPMRWMPYLVLCTVLYGTVVFVRARHATLSRNRLLLALGITAFSAYITASQVVTYWRVQAVVGTLVGLGLVVLWWLLRDGEVAKARGTGRGAAAFVALWTLVLVLVQHHYVGETYAGDRGMPGPVADYKAQVPSVVGDTFMVGHVRPYVTPATKSDPLVLMANAWYVNDRHVQNVHANVGFLAYSERYCMSTLGSTCKGALKNLLATEKTTGLPRADLLSVSSIVLLKSAFPATVLVAPPDGWHVAGETDAEVTWVRDDPVPTAGGVVWTSPGVKVTEVYRDDEFVRLKLDAVPADGGEVVFSRLAWPGYQISNATIAASVDDYLLTLHVSPGSAGGEVTLRYEPPRWHLLLTLLALAFVAGLIWSLAEAIGPRVRRRRAAAEV